MRLIQDFVVENTKPKEILQHYKFNNRPNYAIREFLIGSCLSGISMAHVTIELWPIQYVDHRIQNWIRDIIMPNMAPDAALVIIIKP